MAKETKEKISTSGNATNTVWSTKDDTRSINKSVTPSADNQTRSKGRSDRA